MDVMDNNINAILLDMDGVLFHGERVIPEAVGFMSAIAHLPHAFITSSVASSPDNIKWIKP